MTNSIFVVMEQARELKDFLALNIDATEEDVITAVQGLYNVLVEKETAYFAKEMNTRRPQGMGLENDIGLILSRFVLLINQEKLDEKELSKTVGLLSRFTRLISLRRKLKPNDKRKLSIIKKVDREEKPFYIIRAIPVSPSVNEEGNENTMGIVRPQKVTEEYDDLVEDLIQLMDNFSKELAV